MQTLHQPGDIIRDRYRILKCLGQGGTGSTYAAADSRSQRQVAIKAVSLRQVSDWKVLELFEREARILENLHHPAIPAYLEHFQIDTPGDRCFYLVQELVDGETLAAMVERGCRVTEAEAKKLAGQLLNVLKYLQRLTPPVIHRDIKPQNIVRRRDGRIFLVDFGAVRDVYRNTLTAGTFVGTFGYMPPEQFRGRAFLATDLYGVGATLLFVLTHRSPADLPQNHMKIEFRDRVNISASFAQWLERMVEPAVEDRFTSAEEALDRLHRGISSSSERASRGNYPLNFLTQELERVVEQAVDVGIVSRATPTPIRRTQPKGSRITLQRSRDRLLIEVPPDGFFRLETLLFGAIALFFNGILGMGTGRVLLAALAVDPFFPWFLLLFSIPVWWTALSMLRTFVFIAFGTSTLEINHRTFRIAWKCLGFQGQRQGKTADLAKVEVEVQVSSGGMKSRSKGIKSTYVSLWEGVKKHRLFTEQRGVSDPQLPLVEQEWLVAEISEFLHQLRS